MKRLNCCLLVLAAAVCAVQFAGCSGESSMGTEYVEGVLTLDGTPVPDATVMFTPVVEGQGLAAMGSTDASGTYLLNAVNSGGQTAAAGGGTLAGEYYVGVLKSVVESPMTVEEAEEAGVEYVPVDDYAEPTVTHVVPVRYNTPKDSGIKVTVKAGANTIPIELTSGDAAAPADDAPADDAPADE